MARTVTPHGAAFLRVLQEALGLGDRLIRRLVIDVNLDRDQTVKLHIEEFMPMEAIERICIELPKIDPGVQWVKRIEIDQQPGVVVCQEDDPHDTERDVCRAVLAWWKHATDEMRTAMLRRLELDIHRPQEKATS